MVQVCVANEMIISVQLSRVTTYNLRATYNYNTS